LRLKDPDSGSKNGRCPHFFRPHFFQSLPSPKKILDQHLNQ